MSEPLSKEPGSKEPGSEEARPDRPESSGRSARRTFAPVVLAGLATAALASVAASRPWLGGTTETADATMSALDEGTRYPVASAVSLLLLASWGVLLVTRGRVRRAFAAVAALSAAGLVAAVVVGGLTLPGQAARETSFAEQMGRGGAEEGLNGWFWTTAVVAVLALVAAVQAVRLCPAWPEMGSRYDAPATGEEAVPTRIESERDLWTALDHGQDPTEGPAADPADRPAPGAPH